MNPLLDNHAVRLAGATAISPSPALSPAAKPAAVPGAAIMRGDWPVFHSGAIVFSPPSLPVLSTRNGSLFADRNDPNLHWYLADVALHEDIDAGFAFSARQSGQDVNGNPFYTAQIALSVRKSQPADVIAFAKATPTAKLAEIPLVDLAATLTSYYTDDGGQIRQRDAVGTVKDNGDGTLLLTFSPILGPAVLVLYQDLTVFGRAQVQLSASFQAWTSQGGVVEPRPPLPLPVPPRRPTPWPTRPPISRPASGPSRMEPLMAIDAEPTAPAAMRSFAPIAMQRVVVVDPPPTNAPVQTRQVWQASVPLALKYRQDGYQLKFTVATERIPMRVIRDADDLRDFNGSASEFSELKALGDITERYPSLSRAYIGAFSRTIVVVPSRYSISRGPNGCAAQCLALVDSAASNGSKCKFEFDFVLAPEVSRIEFLQFAHEIALNGDLKDYKLKLPELLQDTPPSSLQTAFKSSAAFTAGADPNTFALSVTIQDESAQTPAVANANLLIAQLCASVGPGLIGSLSVKLDDAYAAPIAAPVLLDFKHTAGAGDIAVRIDESATQIVLTNPASVDLQLSRYALVSDTQIAVVPGMLTLPAGASIAIPLPADHANLAFAADSQLMLPSPMAKSDVARLLAFETADVQETQFVVAIDASGIGFTQIDSIIASVTFSTLPDLAPPALMLSKNVRANSTHIVIPLENAVFSLPGTVNLAIRYSDPGKSPARVTLQNNFTDSPVLILRQSDVDAAVATD